MVVDPPQQPLPSIRTLFGISQNDRLSSIATLPIADDAQACLQPPRAALAHFSLSELHGPLSHAASSSSKPMPHGTASAPSQRITRAYPSNLARTVSTASPSTVPRSAALHAGHAEHTRTRTFSDASSGFDELETHAYSVAPRSHRSIRMAISARAPPPPAASSAAPELAAHHQRRVSSSSSVSARSRSRSPLAQFVHPSKVPSESAGPGGQQHVMMRVQPTHGDGGELTKELLAAKYECQYCGKRFNRPSSLKIHVNTHTGEKPYKCSFPSCGRRFSVMSNMRRHSRVHANQPSTLSAAATLQTPETAWRGVSVSGSEDEASVSGPDSSVSGSPRMPSARKGSPLARMHPYAMGGREGRGGDIQNALFRLPLVPHHTP